MKCPFELPSWMKSDMVLEQLHRQSEMMMNNKDSVKLRTCAVIIHETSTVIQEPCKMAKWQDSKFGIGTCNRLLSTPSPTGGLPLQWLCDDFSIQVPYLTVDHNNFFFFLQFMEEHGNIKGNDIWAKNVPVFYRRPKPTDPQ